MNEVNEIKARLDIVDIVSETVSLRKSGKNFTGFCPFHSNTKTPSFVVFPETQTWRCFGACADGGDLFSFVMKRDGTEFKDVLELLAEKAGVQLHAPSPQVEANKQQRAKLLELTSAATDYFHHLLTSTPEGEAARAYLAKRQFTAETIATFQLGYALNEWDALKTHFLKRGYTTNELLETGLIIERDDGSPGYDRFRQRLMIPIRDTRGQVIGFGARALETDQIPKYLNSPQGNLFDKSATLFGLDLAKKQIRQMDQVVIVEGYMDVIQAFQQKAQNVVAQMGTALTEQQVKILKRYTNNFVLALDADTAGSAATLRGIEIARDSLDREAVPVPTARGLIRFEARLDANIRVAEMPPGKDPDDILKEGADVWQQIIQQALPVVDFYFKTVTDGLDLDSAKDKSTAVDALLPVLRDINNKVEQQHYVQKLARLVRIDERTLLAELNRRSQSGRQRHPSPPTSIVSFTSSPPSAAVTADIVSETGLEEFCLSLLLAHPSALATANQALEQKNIPGLVINDFKHGENRDIFRAIQLWTASEEPTFETLTQIVGHSLTGNLMRLIQTWQERPPAPPERIYKELISAILRLRLQNFAEQINHLSFLQQEAMNTNDSQGAREYTEMVETCRLQRKKLEQTRDALSISGQRRAEVIY